MASLNTMEAVEAHFIGSCEAKGHVPLWQGPISELVAGRETEDLTFA